MAAKNGTISLEYPNPMLNHTLSFYASDVAGVSIKMAKDGKADANSPDRFVAKSLCVVTDVCLEAATGQTTTVVKVDGTPKHVLLNANYLAANAQRPPLNQLLYPGQELSLYQAA